MQQDKLTLRIENKEQGEICTISDGGEIWEGNGKGKGITSFVTDEAQRILTMAYIKLDNTLRNSGLDKDHRIKLGAELTEV